MLKQFKSRETDPKEQTDDQSTHCRSGGISRIHVPGDLALMLFFGKLHFKLGYWAMLPLGVIASGLLGGSSISRLSRA